MYCDAHCHPCDLLENLCPAELEKQLDNVSVAASSWNLKQFEYHESLAAKLEGRVVLCFALHPQFPAYINSAENPDKLNGQIDDALLLLEKLAHEKRIHAVGETGFDLFDDSFRKTEKIQDEIFALHLETAIRYNLPVVLHVRRAMHRIFPYEKKLKKLPAVVFHSWQGTTGEGEAFLRRGINAFFSFGASIVNNHKKARASCALLPLDRLLFETDAPNIPPQGKTFSSWADLPLIYHTAAQLRPEPVPEDVIAMNFARAFGR